jgi:hypothetical protein
MRHMTRDDDIGRPEKRECGRKQNECGRAEGNSGPEREERPSCDERAHNADERRNRLARTHLRAAMLMTAERGEIGVIARPVESVPERRHHA